MVAQSTQDNVIVAPLPPLVPGLPILGNALGMRNDPLSYLLACYHQYGSIYRIKLLNKTVTVMGGLGANQFLARSGEDHFLNGEMFRGFAAELGTLQFLNGLDGPLHKTRRKAVRRSHGRENLQARLAETIRLTREYVSQWPEGQTVAILDTIQRMVTNLQVNIKGIWPRLMLRHPTYLSAKAQANALGRQIVADHRQYPPTDRPVDLVDELINEVDDDGNHLPEEVILAETVGSFNSGLDTLSNTICFILYGILHTPELLARVTAEVDALFADGLNDLQAIKDASSLHYAAMEAMRLYPVAPLTYRTVSDSFVFDGYRVEQGSHVFIANTITHYLPEYFPNPERFDVDRYNEGIAKSRPANVWTPYTLGAHTCLGAGLAESLALVAVATILHTIEFKPLSETFKVHLNPIPSLGRRFALHVIRHRHS